MNSHQYFQPDFLPNMVSGQNPQQFNPFNSNEAMTNPFPGNSSFADNQDKNSKISGK